MLVLRIAEGKNHLKDWLKENEADSKAGTFTEGLSELNTHDDAEHKVRTGDNREEAEHWFHVQDLKHGVSVVDWDERFPALFASFFEDFPLGDNDENSPGDDAEEEEEAEETGEDPCARSRGGHWVVV